MYSGTYTVTERTYDDVYFNCPGATHFAIMMTSEPDLATGKGFLCSLMTDGKRRIMQHSTQSGTTAAMGNNLNGITSNAAYPSVEYVDTGIIIKAINPNDYFRWFQPGTYDWCAW